MSKNVVKASSEGQGDQEPDSVFDFLYHDSRRVASFLAQFDENGLLTGLTQGEGVTKGSKRSKKFGVGGTSPIGGGNLEFEIGPGESGTQSSERSYDPFWANARQFLDVLEERKMIQRDITTAAMGQFVLAKGSLIISDLQMMQAVWKSEVVRRYVKASVEQETSAQDAQRSAKVKRELAKNAQPSEADLVLELLPHLPHSSQFHLVNGNESVWATIDPVSMVGSVADIILKHGAKIAGEWSMLGILDGRPYESGDMLTTLESIMVGMTGESITKVPLNLAPVIRNLLGRPLLAYGMTPLLIFREVS